MISLTFVLIVVLIAIVSKSNLPRFWPPGEEYMDTEHERVLRAKSPAEILQFALRREYHHEFESGNVLFRLKFPVGAVSSDLKLSEFVDEELYASNANGVLIRYEWDEDFRWRITIWNDQMTNLLSKSTCDGEWIESENAIWDVRFLDASESERLVTSSVTSTGVSYQESRKAFREATWAFSLVAGGHLFPRSRGRFFQSLPFIELFKSQYSNDTTSDRHNEPHLACVRLPIPHSDNSISRLETDVPSFKFWYIFDVVDPQHGFIPIRQYTDTGPVHQVWSDAVRIGNTYIPTHFQLLIGESITDSSVLIASDIIVNESKFGQNSKLEFIPISLNHKPVISLH